MIIKEIYANANMNKMIGTLNNVKKKEKNKKIS